MKKIDRYSFCAYEKWPSKSTIMAIVKESDLDALEAENKLLDDDSPEGHKVTNQQYINVLTEKKELEQQRDEAIEVLIEDVIELDKCRPRTMGTVGTKLWSTLNKRIMLITKITGQTWQEIKAGKR